MPRDSSSGRRHDIHIDRLEIAVPDGEMASKETYRRRIAAELQRELERSDVLEGLESTRRDRVRIEVTASEAGSPASVARRIVSSLMGSTTERTGS